MRGFFSKLAGGRDDDEDKFYDAQEVRPGRMPAQGDTGRNIHVLMIWPLAGEKAILSLGGYREMRSTLV